MRTDRTLDRALQNIVTLGVPLASAVRMVTANPARQIGLGSRKGILAVGADADRSDAGPGAAKYRDAGRSAGLGCAHGDSESGAANRSRLTQGHTGGWSGCGPIGRWTGRCKIS